MITSMSKLSHTSQGAERAPPEAARGAPRHAGRQVRARGQAEGQVQPEHDALPAQPPGEL